MTEAKVIQYADDALLTEPDVDVINGHDVRTLDEMFRERVRRSANKVAYIQFDEKQNSWVNYTWAEIAAEVERWQVAFKDEGLEKGDRVAIRYKNSIEWVVFDQAALRLGLVVVPIYTADRADNASYVLAHAGASLLAIQSVDDWKEIKDCGDDLSSLKRVLVFADDETEGVLTRNVASWLPEQGQHLERGLAEADDLATIVYTSGTTGRPKGVMLSHLNILSNAYSGMRNQPIRTTDLSVSFLPLSHVLERTVGYYAAIMGGATVAYNRSIDVLIEDIQLIKPTLLMSVPRIFERAHNQIFAKAKAKGGLSQALLEKTIDIGWHRFSYEQGMASWHPKIWLWPLLNKLVASKVQNVFGGRLRCAMIGGAPLSPIVAKTFIGLGMPLLQGYGLTETSPVVSTNTINNNRPDSIGLPIRGVEISIAEHNELWVRGSNVMIGYWQNDEATEDAITEDGWLKTGDCASIDEEGYLRIIGRIKDILVLANGEKVPPADIEAAIADDSLVEQVMLLGEGKPYLSALLVLNKDQWEKFKQDSQFTDDDLGTDNLSDIMLERIAKKMKEFPGYARIRKVHISLDEWTIESGLLTPTLKLKRPKVMKEFSAEINQMYAGHGVMNS